MLAKGYGNLDWFYVLPKALFGKEVISSDVANASISSTTDPLGQTCFIEQLNSRQCSRIQNVFLIERFQGLCCRLIMLRIAYLKHVSFSCRIKMRGALNSNKLHDQRIV